MDKNIRAHGLKTPYSAKTNSTPSGKFIGQLTATPPVHPSSTPHHTPRTPGLTSSRTDLSKSTPRLPSHTATPLSAKGTVYHGSRTPLPSSHSRHMGGTSASRFGVIDSLLTGRSFDFTCLMINWGRYQRRELLVNKFLYLLF